MLTHLTVEEVEEILTATDVQINVVDPLGHIEVAWETGTPEEGTYKRWPAIVVVQRRAEKDGVEYTENDEENDSIDYTDLKEQALKDVAAELAYADIYAYNNACRDDPWEVASRLAALREKA